MRRLPEGPWFHGTRAVFERLRPGEDGAIHLGTREQAQTRAGTRGRILPVELTESRVRVVRTRDDGAWSRQKIASLRRRADVVVYLNRWEGIEPERFDQARLDGLNVDALSDAAFCRRFPEARDSLLVFDPQFLRPAPAAEPTPQGA